MPWQLQGPTLVAHAMSQTGFDQVLLQVGAVAAVAAAAALLDFGCAAAAAAAALAAAAFQVADAALLIHILV